MLKNRSEMQDQMKVLRSKYQEANKERQAAIDDLVKSERKVRRLQKQVRDLKKELKDS